MVSGAFGVNHWQAGISEYRQNIINQVEELVDEEPVIEIEEEIVEFEVERGRPRELRERAGPHQIAQLEEFVDEGLVDEGLVVENDNLDISDDMEDLGTQNQPGRGG